MAEDSEGKHWWCLWAGNGQKIAVSPEGYGSRKHAIQALRLLASNSAAAKLIAKSGDES